MSPAPSSAHPADAAATSTRFAHETLGGFRRLGADVTVIGGWGLCLYGSPVYSIDLDVLIPERDWDRPDVYDFVAARTDHHKAAFADSYLEVNALEWPNRLWVLGTGFRPGDLVATYGRQRRQVTMHDQTIIAEVPVPAVLAFFKVKAACNRANKLDALRSPRRLAGLDAADREIIAGTTPQFFVRKVAKDLVDVSYLVRHTTPTAIADVAERSGIRRELLGLFPKITGDLFDAADRIAAEYRINAPTRETWTSVRKAFERLA